MRNRAILNQGEGGLYGLVSAKDSQPAGEPTDRSINEVFEFNVASLPRRVFAIWPTWPKSDAAGENLSATQLARLYAKRRHEIFPSRLWSHKTGLDGLTDEMYGAKRGVQASSQLLDDTEL